MTCASPRQRTVRGLEVSRATRRYAAIIVLVCCCGACLGAQMAVMALYMAVLVAVHAAALHGQALPSNVS